MKNSFKNWLYAVLPIMIGVVILVVSCKKDEKKGTCKVEEDNLKVAQTKLTEVTKSFNTNADSCLYVWGEQVKNRLPNWYNNGVAPHIPQNASKKDSVDVFVSYAGDITAPNQQGPDVTGLIRTGEKSQEIFPGIAPAEVAKNSAQSALTNCQSHQ